MPFHAFRRALTGASLLFFFLATPVHADEAARKARKLYESGTAHYNLGDYGLALADFKAAYLLKQDAAFLFNIGQAYRHMGMPADAARTYRAYLRSPKAANREMVERFIAEADAAAQATAKSASALPAGVQPPSLEAHSATVAEEAASPASHTMPSADEPVPIAAVTPDVQETQETQASAQRKPSRKVLWIGLGVGGGVLLAGGAIGLGVGLTSSANPPTSDFGTFTPVFP